MRAILRLLCSVAVVLLLAPERSDAAALWSRPRSFLATSEHTPELSERGGDGVDPKHDGTGLRRPALRIDASDVLLTGDGIKSAADILRGLGTGGSTVRFERSPTRTRLDKSAESAVETDDLDDLNVFDRQVEATDEPVITTVTTIPPDGSTTTAAPNVSTTETGPAGLGEDCETTDDCMVGLQCNGLTCVNQGAEGDACSTNDDCILALVCPSDGVCAVGLGDVAEGGPCNANEDCSDGLVCRDDFCIASQEADEGTGAEGDSCEADVDCSPDLVCPVDVCAVPSSVGGLCSSTSDCADGVCGAEGVCVSTAAVGSDDGGSDNEVNAGAIAGGVVAGIIILGSIATVAVVMRCKNGPTQATSGGGGSSGGGVSAQHTGPPHPAAPATGVPAKVPDAAMTESVTPSGQGAPARTETQASVPEPPPVSSGVTATYVEAPSAVLPVPPPPLNVSAGDGTFVSVDTGSGSKESNGAQEVDQALYLSGPVMPPLPGMDNGAPGGQNVVSRYGNDELSTDSQLPPSLRDIQNRSLLQTVSDANDSNRSGMVAPPPPPRVDEGQ